MSGPLSDDNDGHGQLPVDRALIRHLLVGGAIICALFALVAALQTWHYLQTALRAPGKVIRLIENDTGDGVVYRPVFQFKDDSGNEHTVTSSLDSKPATQQVGDEITVVYQRDAPQWAKIHNFGELWFVPTVAMLIGVGYGVLAFLTGMRGAKMKSSSD